MAGWTVTAHKPASGFAFETEYEGLTLKPAELWVLPPTAGERGEYFGLRVGVPGLNRDDEARTLAALWIVLDTGLGEKRCAESIAHLEVEPLPKQPAQRGHIELVELSDYLVRRASQGQAAS
ncbi:MAG TPA: hypothetical protein VGQ83_43390 [Polyangia bacterium]